MSQLSTQPYKGSRDFFPEDMAIQNYIFDTMRMAVESFGFQEYTAPLLEDAELYKAKTGDEIVNEQTYTFTDRGGREVTIRPEMTPTLARMVASQRKSLQFPLRWYSIPNLWRYERPQRGRLREHWQLNVDLLGNDSLSADVEIIAVADHIMKSFYAPENSYAIKVNDRKLINALLFEFLSLTEEQAHKTIKLIDRKEKMEADKFSASLSEIMGDENASKLNNVFSEVEEKGLQGLPQLVLEKEEVQHLQKLIERLNKLNISSVMFDITLMRGFDYYTGVVFEIFDTNPVNKRSIFGGGRFDELVGIFDVESVAAIGFGMGDVVIADFLETYNLLPEFYSATDLYICTFGEEYHDAAQKLAQQLREQNINIITDISTKKITKQIQSAEKQNIEHIICIGENEVQNGTFKLKNLTDGTETDVTLQEIVERLG